VVELDLKSELERAFAGLIKAATCWGGYRPGVLDRLSSPRRARALERRARPRGVSPTRFRPDSALSRAAPATDINYMALAGRPRLPRGLRRPGRGLSADADHASSLQAALAALAALFRRRESGRGPHRRDPLLILVLACMAIPLTLRSRGRCPNLGAQNPDAAPRPLRTSTSRRRQVSPSVAVRFRSGRRCCRPSAGTVDRPHDDPARIARRIAEVES